LLIGRIGIGSFELDQTFHLQPCQGFESRKEVRTMRKTSLSGKEKARTLRSLLRVTQLQAFTLAIVALAALIALLK
jgi:hypothetical protein